MALSDNDYHAVVEMIDQYTKNHERSCKFWIDQHFVALYYEKQSKDIFTYWDVQKHCKPLSRKGIYTIGNTTPPFIREIYFRMNENEMTDSEWREYQDQFRAILIESKLFSKRQVMNARITNLLEIYTVELEKIKPQNNGDDYKNEIEQIEDDQEKESCSWFYKILNVLGKIYV
jgi:hypothetical protein